MRSATCSAPPGKARPRITEPALAATSPTGARLTLIPAARRSRAAPRASAVARAGVAAADWPSTGRAHVRLRISPPSWSVLTSAEPPAARCSVRTTRLRSAREAMLSLNRITPAARPARSARGT